MRRPRLAVFLPFALALALCALPPPPAFAAEKYQGTITSTGTSANAQVKNGAALSIQCDAAAYYKLGVGSSTAATTNDWKVDASPGYDIDPLPPEDNLAANASGTYLAIISVTGTSNCRWFVRSK